jgi:hypothetical protein
MPTDAPQKKRPRIEIVLMSTGEVVETIPMDGAGSRKVETVLRGLLRQMGERFLAREVDCE